MTAEWGSLGEALAKTRRENPQFSEDECKELIVDALDSGWVAWRPAGPPEDVRPKRDGIAYTVKIEVNLPGLAAYLGRGVLGLEAAINMTMSRMGTSRRRARALVMKAIKDGKLDITVTHPPGEV